MAIRQLNPYLNFNGTGAKAIALYEKALGAKTSDVMRHGDVPGGCPQQGDKDRIIHARLALGGGVVMISDMPPNMPAPPAGNVHVCLDFDDASDMKAKFDALSEGGNVTTPLQDTFWGATFGMVTDAYGVSWMFNCNKK